MRSPTPWLAAPPATYGQIQLNADGTYTYTLTSAPKTSPNANDGPNTLSESFTYKATDALGDTTTSTLVVNIVDDVPKAVASDRSVTAVEIDSNLLIVLESPAAWPMPRAYRACRAWRLPSRRSVPCSTSTTIWASQSPTGDLQQQRHRQNAVWVDVATAKTMLAGLTAGGGTNYDAAVAVMQTAFNTSGKLTGAQNVGYFFSDGKPNEGDIDAADEAALKNFLDANNIKNYAIGLGSGVSNANLDPLA